MDNDAIEFFLHIGSKIDNVNETLTDIKIISAIQTASLKEHMSRTMLAEARLDAFESEVRPILDGLKFFKKLGKFAIASTAFIATIIKIFGKS